MDWAATLARTSAELMADERSLERKAATLAISSGRIW